MNKFLLGNNFLCMLFLGLLTFGCGTTRNAEQVVMPTPDQIISDHVLLMDPAILIDDLGNYPEYAGCIEAVLYERIDYNDYNYTDLKKYSRLAQDDFDASVFF